MVQSLFFLFYCNIRGNRAVQREIIPTDEVNERKAETSAAAAGIVDKQEGNEKHIIITENGATLSINLDSSTV